MLIHDPQVGKCPKSDASSPARLSTFVSLSRYEAQSLLVFPSSGSAHAAPPFPRSGPGGPGSPLSSVLCGRYDPLTCVPSAYLFASRYRGALPGVCAFARALPPSGQRRTVGRGLLFLPAFPFRPSISHGQGRVSQVPWRAIPWLCDDPATPADPSHLALDGAPGAAPTVWKMKASTLCISGLNSVALPPAVYASRRAIATRPCNTRFQLTGCVFAGRESNPLARDERFQLINTSFPCIPLFRAFLAQPH